MKNDNAKSGPSAEEILQGVVEQAALCGPFDPLHLLPADLTTALRSDVLRRLGRVVDDVAGTPPRWTLKPDERRRVLTGLANSGAVRKILARSGTPADDPFAVALKSALTGRDSGMLPRENQDDAYAARNYAMAAPFAAARKSADPQALRRQIAAEQVEARRRVVLPHGLYGRDEVRASIVKFLHSALPQEAALLVTGVGGIGKSALIADIVGKEFKDPKTQAVVVLDFDRPNLFGGDRIEIAREITRQLGRQWPDLEKRLSEARAEFPNVGPASDSSAYFSQLNLVLGKLRTALSPGPAVPVAIFLDTFEEVIVRGEAALADMLDWMQSLRTSGGLTRLDVVVSGRSAPVLKPEEFARRFSRHVDLPGLSPKAGARLLREDAAGRKLFTPARARRAATALKGHPQALRLLKRYGAEHPDDIDGIIRDGLNDPNFGVQFAQVFLYSRILGRIRDPEVRQLAHPGLVLRRVTPALIADVLAGPCDFKKFDAATALDLFHRLAATVWIVDQTDHPDVVTHRRELRRLMLPAMNNPDPTNPEKLELGRKARMIHETAAAWYGAHRDTLLSPDLQDTEAFYHRASIHPDTVELAELEQRAGSLGEDIADLPPRVQAMAKFLQGRGASMNAQELELLPEDLRDQLDRGLEAYALRRGDTGAVKRRVTSRAKPPDVRKPVVAVSDDPIEPAVTGAEPIAGTPNRPIPRTFAEAETLYSNEIHALWAEGDFDGVVAVADQAFGALWENGTREKVIEYRADPVYFGVWKSLLARVVTGVWPESLCGPDAIGLIGRLYPERLQLVETQSLAVVPTELHLAAIALARKAQSAAGSDLAEPAGLEYELNLVRFNRNASVSRMFDMRVDRLVSFNLPDDPTKTQIGRSVSGDLLRLLTPVDAQMILQSADGGSTVPEMVFTFAGPPDMAMLDDLRSRVHGANPPQVPMDQLGRWLAAMGLGQVQLPGTTPNANREQPDRRYLLRLNELFDPIANALAPLAARDDGLVQLLGVCQNATVWPDELTPDGFVSPSPSDRHLFLARLVDIADQADLLPDLMRIACAMAPEDQRLAKVALLVDRVEAIFNNRPAQTAIAPGGQT